jgi:hypothetical protein
MRVSALAALAAFAFSPVIAASVAARQSSCTYYCPPAYLSYTSVGDGTFFCESEYGQSNSYSLTACLPSSRKSATHPSAPAGRHLYHELVGGPGVVRVRAGHAERVLVRVPVEQRRHPVRVEPVPDGLARLRARVRVSGRGVLRILGRGTSLRLAGRRLY